MKRNKIHVDFVSDELIAASGLCLFFSRSSSLQRDIYTFAFVLIIQTFLFGRGPASARFYLENGEEKERKTEGKKERKTERKREENRETLTSGQFEIFIHDNVRLS